MTEPDAASDLDAIAQALSRLRGRGRGPFEHEGPHADGPHSHRGGPHQRGPWAHGGGPGMRGRAEWAAGARFGGPARMRLLEALATASHPLSVSEVGEAIGVDQPRASRLIQQSVELGLVRREADPDDARRTRVALTDEGSRFARGFRGQRREHLSEALADFSTAERAELVRLLTKLAEAWPQR